MSGFRIPRATTAQMIAGIELRSRTSHLAGALSTVRQPSAVVSTAIRRIHALRQQDPEIESLLRQVDEASRNLKAGRGCDLVRTAASTNEILSGTGGDGSIDYRDGHSVIHEPIPTKHVEGSVELKMEDGKPFAVSKIYEDYKVTWMKANVHVGYVVTPKNRHNDDTLNRFRKDVKEAMKTNEALRSFVTENAKEIGITV
ncbi:MAG: hypothetical protein Q7S22_07235 [Candidatus Micrarchaeota archaeon]|nr:hypothetical protein [Candidatus Micrarchaeota archaeon]